MANRTTYLDNVWAKEAAAVPSVPIEETAYTKPTITQEEIETGWRYKKVESSAIFNEVMKRMTGLIQLMEQYGVLPWCPNITYPAGALVTGADAFLYQAVQVSLNVDPIGAPTYWIKFSNSTSHITDLSGGVHGATASSTANMIVRRDSSRNFSAGTITATLAGNAATATNATDHIAVVSGTVHGATSFATANKIMLRNENGQAEVHAAVSQYQAVNLGQFPATLAEIGSFGLPSGVIIKTGLVVSSTENSGVTTFFSIAFPNACFGVFLTDLSAAAAKAVVWSKSSHNQASFVSYWTRSGEAYTTPNRTAFFIAIGN